MTARRMTSGELVKERQGVGITRGDEAVRPASSRLTLTMPAAGMVYLAVPPGLPRSARCADDVDVYRTELEVTSRINRYLSDAGFRNIALGENYFRLLALEYEAPRVCAD